MADARFEGDVVQRRLPLPDKRVEVVIERHALTINAARSELVEGFHGGAFEAMEDGRFRVLLAAAWHRGKMFAPWCFLVPDRATARSMLRAAGVDADQGVLRVHLHDRLSASHRMALLACGTLIGVLGFAWAWKVLAGSLVSYLFLGFAFVPILLRHRWSRVEIVIGTDGVLRRGESTRFAAFSSIRPVELSESGLSLERFRGPPFVLVRVPQRAPDEHLEEDNFCELMALRIREAIAEQAQTRATATDARRDMPILAWIREMRAQPANVPTYRVAPTREHDHDAIFEDGTADIVTRACSAIALRVKEGEGIVPRLRVAAAASASPDLRAALEKIADGAPDDEIAKSIERLR